MKRNFFLRNFNELIWGLSTYPSVLYVTYTHYLLISQFWTFFPSLSTRPSWGNDKCVFFFPFCFSDERVFLLFHKNLSDSLTQLAQAIHAVLSRKKIIKCSFNDGFCSILNSTFQINLWMVVKPQLKPILASKHLLMLWLKRSMMMMNSKYVHPKAT